jgi:hypothetical protein
MVPGARRAQEQAQQLEQGQVQPPSCHSWSQWRRYWSGFQARVPQESRGFQYSSVTRWEMKCSQGNESDYGHGGEILTFASRALEKQREVIAEQQ